MPEVKLVTCRPVDWSNMKELAVIPESTIYPGSVVGNCTECGVDIFIGPKSQQFMKRNTAIKPYCFMCAVEKAQHYSPENTRILSLDHHAGRH